MHARIGELLSRMAHLSSHDIQEILEEQRATHRRFGEIALAWGLCRPEDIWRAWVEQAESDSADACPSIDLAQIGIDAQAACLLPAEVARQAVAIPIRCMDDQIVIAIASLENAVARQTLADRLGKPLRFVRADSAQIHAAINACCRRHSAA